MNGHDARGRLDPVRRFNLDRQTVFVTGPVDPDLIADKQNGQECERPEPFEVHALSPAPVLRSRFPLFAWHNRRVGVKPARHLRLIPDAFGERVRSEIRGRRKQGDSLG
jgi:hypothetical protein